MTDTPDFEIFLATLPGMEPTLADEARELGFANPTVQPGGVSILDGWPEVWRANIMLRGASRVLARIGSFRAMHLAQLDKRARKFPWAETLRPGAVVKVETTCHRSRIYHAGAATQRIETALKEEAGATIAADAPLRIMARIEDDLVTISLDTSGEPLHKRGHKQAVGKAPMRETLAALFLRQCGYTGGEPVLDPMCGSGTFVIEAAEIAMTLPPGRGRAFAFEDLASIDAKAVAALRQGTRKPTGMTFYGSDRDQGAVRMAGQNAERAGVADVTRFACRPISDLERPEGPPGLVIVNPPYGARIGDKKPLFGLHASLGRVLTERFSGWRVGIITTEPQLARATGLPFLTPGPPIPHGGLKVRLYQTAALS